MFRHLTKQLKRHRSGLTQAVALFFAATILIASIGRTKATTLRLTPPPATAGDGGLFSFSGDDHGRDRGERSRFFFLMLAR